MFSCHHIPTNSIKLLFLHITTHTTHNSSNCSDERLLHLKCQLLNSIQWPIYIINSVINTKLPCYTLPESSTTVSSLFVPEIILFLTKNLTFLAQVLSWTFFSLNEFAIKMRFYFCFADLSPEYPPFYLLIQLLHLESSACTVQVRLVNARKLLLAFRKIMI